MLKKVLIALDGSEHANKALEFALELVENHSPEIILLSVVAPLSTPIQTSYPGGGDEYYTTLKASHKQVLEDALRKAKQLKPSLPLSIKLVEGQPADEIVGMAKSGNFDLIVIGDRGYSGIKEFLLGSVSDRVADKAMCPVLIVK